MLSASSNRAMGIFKSDDDLQTDLELGKFGEVGEFRHSLVLFKFFHVLLRGLALRRIGSSFIHSRIHFYLYLFSWSVFQISSSYMIFLIWYFII